MRLEWQKNYGRAAGREDREKDETNGINGTIENQKGDVVRTMGTRGEGDILG